MHDHDFNATPQPLIQKKIVHIFHQHKPKRAHSFHTQPMKSELRGELSINQLRLQTSTDTHTHTHTVTHSKSKPEHKHWPRLCFSFSFLFGSFSERAHNEGFRRPFLLVEIFGDRAPTCRIGVGGPTSTSPRPLPPPAPPCSPLLLILAGTGDRVVTLASLLWPCFCEDLLLLPILQGDNCNSPHVVLAPAHTLPCIDGVHKPPGTVLPLSLNFINNALRWPATEKSCSGILLFHSTYDIVFWNWDLFLGFEPTV